MALTGAVVQVGNESAFGIGETSPAGLASIGTTLYMVGSAFNVLYQVSRTTGAAATVGISSNFGVSETSPRGLASIGNTLYMVGNTNDVLYTLNTTTGAATQVGTTAAGFGVSETNPRGLASIGNTLYMLGGSNDALFTLDTTTGAATQVGNTDAGFGVNEDIPTGLGNIGDTLYMVGTRTDSIYTLDTTTGAATLIGGIDTAELGDEGRPQGLASIGHSLYMVGDENNVLYRFVSTPDFPATVQDINVDESTSDTYNLDDIITGATSYAFTSGYTNPTWLSISDNNLVFTNLPAVDTDTTHVVQITATNVDGSTDGTVRVIIRDVDNPLVVTPTIPSGTQTGAFTVSLAFSEGVSGVASSDFGTGGSGATVSANVVSPLLTNLTVTPQDDRSGDIVLTLIANSIIRTSDSNTYPTANLILGTIPYDTRDAITASWAVSTGSMMSPLMAFSVTGVLTFSEDVEGLTTSDFSATNNANIREINPLSAATYQVVIDFPVAESNTVVTLSAESVNRAGDTTDLWPAAAVPTNTIYFDNPPLSGAAVRIGTATNFGVGEAGPQGLGSIGSTLYMVGANNQVLYTLNTTNGEATQVGTTDAGFGVGETRPQGLASIGNTLYMVGVDNDVLYTLDTTTGAATQVGTTAAGFGVGENSPQGLDSIGSTLYMVGSGTDALYTLDTTTGAATRVGNVQEFGVSEDNPTELASIGDTLYMLGNRNKALFRLIHDAAAITATWSGLPVTAADNRLMSRTFTATLTFSENIEGLISSDITPEGATSATIAVAGSDDTYTITVSDLPESQGIITLVLGRDSVYREGEPTETYPVSNVRSNDVYFDNAPPPPPPVPETSSIINAVSPAVLVDTRIPEIYFQSIDAPNGVQMNSPVSFTVLLNRALLTGETFEPADVGVDGISGAAVDTITPTTNTNEYNIVVSFPNNSSGVLRIYLIES